MNKRKDRIYAMQLFYRVLMRLVMVVTVVNRWWWKRR